MGYSESNELRPLSVALSLVIKYFLPEAELCDTSAYSMNGRLLFRAGSPGLNQQKNCHPERTGSPAGGPGLNQ